MLLGLLAAAPSAFALVPYVDPYSIPKHRIHRRKSSTFNGSTPQVEIAIDGKLSFTTVENATFFPTECLVPGGIAGNFVGNASGAYTFTVQTGFVSWKGYERIFEREVVGVGRDGSILLAARDEPSGITDPFEYRSEPGEAWIVRGDRETSVGPAESVSLDLDGAVSGYALRRPNGSYCGAAFPYEDARPEAFVWKGGVRRSLGEWVLQARNARGFAIGYRLPKGATKLEGEAPPEWVRWRGGRLEPLAFPGLPRVSYIWLRGDDSLILDFGNAGYTVWRDGKTRLIPMVIGGRHLQPESLRVDRKDVVSIADRRGHRWRLIEMKSARS